MEDINQPTNYTLESQPDKISELECWSSSLTSLDPLTGVLTAVTSQQDHTAVVEVPAGVVTAAGREAVWLPPPA